MADHNQLKPEQVDQLVGSIVRDSDGAVYAYLALKDGPRFSDENQKKLVDKIAAGNAQVAQWTLKDIAWLTEAQKTQLKVVA